MNSDLQTLPSVWIVRVFDVAGKYESHGGVFWTKEQAEEHVASTPPCHKLRIVECLPPPGAAEWHLEHEKRTKGDL